MISKKMTDALNEQITAEFHSAYLYLSMAAYFENLNLPGCAHWMELQYQEELMHAMKMYAYLNDRGGRVLLATVDGPVTEWASPMAAFEAAYEHEQYITSRINALMKLATEENDFAANTFLQWFVNEQVEEEATVNEIVESFRLMGDNKRGLFMLDRELKQRMPSPTGTQEA